MNGRSLVLVSLGMIAIAAVAAAHPHPYLLGTDLVSVGGVDGVPDIGGVSFSPGEVQADANGFVTFEIHDVVFDNVGGFLCQDLNDDSVCGDDGTIALVEPSHNFCFTVSVNDLSPLNTILLFLDGPLSGNPIVSGCDPATTGEVDHS